MSTATKPTLFVSHTHADKPLVEAFKGLVVAVIGDGVSVHSSSDEELGSGIDFGKSWYRWILDEVKECRAAVVLLTPASVQKPWLMWEAGAVYGAALVGEAGDGEGKVQPLIFGLSNDEIPSPFQPLQAAPGDDHMKMKKLLGQLISKTFSDLFPSHEQVINAAGRMEAALDDYLRVVADVMEREPMLPTEGIVQEWLARIDTLIRDQRHSEVPRVHEWMNIAFGRSADARFEDAPDEPPTPIDLRIHRRLGEFYQGVEDYPRAIEQYALARRLAPRDMFLLRRLGKAYLDAKMYHDAGRMIEYIDRLDQQACSVDEELCALRARWLRETGRGGEAADHLQKCRDRNSGSSYLADLHAQALIGSDRSEEAKGVYRDLEAMLLGRRSSDIWSLASLATAQLFQGKSEEGVVTLKEIGSMAPDPAVRSSIERGLAQIAEVLPEGGEQLERWRAALSCR